MTTDNPFSPGLSRESFLETNAAGEALRRLDEGLGAREPFLLVTGDSGTGKSALANEAVARWGERATAAYLAFPPLTGVELLEEILRRFGAEPPEGARPPKLVACLERVIAEVTGRGQTAVIVVDDAHHLPPGRLEELRLLANAAQQARRPLEVMLVGLPALDALLEHPALAALRERVSVRVKLEPLPAGETRRYIRHRINAAGDDRSNLFPRKTCEEIAERSGGVPRRINALASEALRLAHAAGQPTVEPGHVQEAAEKLWGAPEMRTPEAPAAVPAGAPATARAGVAAAAPAARPAAPATSPVRRPAARAPESVAHAPGPAPAARAPEPAPAAPAPAKAAPAARAAEAALPPAHASEPDVMTVSAAAAVTAADAPQPVPTAPDPAPPTSHDPHEWVARFVGDKGPLQISSMSRPWNPEEFEPEEKITRTEVPPLAPRHPRSTPAPPRPRSGGGLRVITTVALILIAALAVILLVLRATRNAPSPAARAPDVTTTAADRPQSRPAAPSRASRPAARAAVDPGTAQPAVSPGTPDAAPPIPRGPYTLDAGVQLDQQTAFQECDRMQKLTGIRAWIVPAADPGSGQYRIVLGVFRSYTRASSAARMLMTSRTLANVTVVTLPPRDSRH